MNNILTFVGVFMGTFIVFGLLVLWFVFCNTIQNPGLSFALAFGVPISIATAVMVTLYRL